MGLNLSDVTQIKPARVAVSAMALPTGSLAQLQPSADARVKGPFEGNSGRCRKRCTSECVTAAGFDKFNNTRQGASLGSAACPYDGR